MGVSVLNISTGDAVAELPWNGSVVHITWDPAKYTPESEEQWRAIEEEGYVGVLMVQFVTDVVTSWDLMGDVDPSSGKLVEADHSFPLEPDKVRKIPHQFLGAVMVAIRDSAGPKEERNETSDDG
jgi:hypothetical protein